ncbi:MAG: hypothetical protein P5702_21845 [Limnospira sp. PMC 1291.21]|uniref:Uncharacterized protein n=1 Tax=Limnospira fusiformis PMC 851.14 TaxID=2219512 RepID=A0ABU9ESA0_LIMFS|nr:MULTISPECIES: hypothetical protein [unclassified Limnospira]MDT9287456.1 hypothetical protein [Limnospira sp. PMC 1298.21]MDT9323256.1 hypothetical protein [Limnospira sp. PMC 1290.21]MDT9189428.1 hypothetical protein [Limnospira sp. PMC 894.15]MDT9194307.1 hypothetical protein [Limnospira sp. PMC 1245.20]MDT9204999.1 hypothetical protein [Limnospira sp. PMC 1243.20]
MRAQFVSVLDRNVSDDSAFLDVHILIIHAPMIEHQTYIWSLEHG